MAIEPYLFFNGHCEAAIELYRSVFGAEVLMLMRFRDSPEPPQPGMVPPGSEDKVMHATLKIGDTQLMVSDGMNSGTASFQGFSLSMAMPDEAAAHKAFDALADGGTVTMPIARTFWSPCFGMVNDRFGVPWMITVAA
jgi:PhnB protein